MASGRRTATRSWRSTTTRRTSRRNAASSSSYSSSSSSGRTIDAPLIGVVSRLVEQKGIDLLTLVLPALLSDTRASFAVLGNGDAPIAATLRAIADSYPRRVSFTEGYDEKLAHEIFAGSDLTVVPSRYEPCGLTQMYALRYGTIPVVRATGGLADTIQHFDAALGHGQRQRVSRRRPARRPVGREHRARLVRRPRRLVAPVGNAMAADFSWPKQVPHYEALYRSLL